MEDNTTGKESMIIKLTGGNAKIICGIITVVAIFLIVFLILSYDGEKVYKPGTDSGGGGGVPVGPVVAGKGDTVYVTYVGRLDNGTVFDSGNLSFIAGSGQMIIGLDEAIIGMQKGEEKNITIPKEKAYGDYDNKKIVNVERVITLPRFVNISVKQYKQESGKDPVEGEFFSSADVPWQVRIAAVINDTLLVDLSPNKDKFTEIIGERIVTLNKNEIILQLNLDSEPGINTVQMTQNGPAIISKINETAVVLDFNNPLAGKTLMFEIKINDIIKENESSAQQQPAENRVVILEFSDFQCPYCSKAVPTLNKIKETYGDKVEIVFKQFPLSFHSSAQNASEASECARDQGKFWEYHDKLFANQMALSADDLKKYASELGLDIAKFNSCLDSREKMPVVQKDIATGQAMGVTGTPTFFIGDYKLIGAQPFETFKKLIDEKLNASDTQKPVETKGELKYVPDTAPPGGFKSFKSKDPNAQICTLNGRPVVYLFTTTWCPHCNFIRDTFDKTVKEYVDERKIIAYHWEIDTNDNLLTPNVETSVPGPDIEIYKTFNPQGSIPTFVFGCKYYRIGNGYEGQHDGLTLEEKEFREVIEHLINSS